MTFETIGYSSSDKKALRFDIAGNKMKSTKFLAHTKPTTKLQFPVTSPVCRIDRHLNNKSLHITC